MSDEINHPAHYIEGRQFEPIDVIEDWELSYCLGNCVKYISRAGRKPGADMLKDLQKAQWYLMREINRMNSGVIEENEIVLGIDDPLPLPHDVIHQPGGSIAS